MCIEQSKVRTILETKYILDLPIGKDNWEVETYMNNLQKIMYFFPHKKGDMYGSSLNEFNDLQSQKKRKQIEYHYETTSSK